MGKLWPWFVTICGLAVVAGSSEPTDDEGGQLSLMEGFTNGGVWRFTCDEYCSYCGCVGQFHRNPDKCVCSCAPGAADWDCLEDVKQTKEFLGLNYTLEIRENKSNPVEDTAGPNLRVQRQVDSPPSPRRRSKGRRSPRPGRGAPRVSPNPERPHRRRRERRPFRRREPEPLEPTSP